MKYLSLDAYLHFINSSVTKLHLDTELVMYAENFAPFLFFNFLMFIFERDRVQAGEGQRERETHNLKQASGSERSVQNPTRGSNPRTVRS